MLVIYHLKEGGKYAVPHNDIILVAHVCEEQVAT
jgi:hypothetical protein